MEDVQIHVMVGLVRVHVHIMVGGVQAMEHSSNVLVQQIHRLQLLEIIYSHHIRVHKILQKNIILLVIFFKDVLHHNNMEQ
jgi:hypothetical protein